GASSLERLQLSELPVGRHHGRCSHRAGVEDDVVGLVHARGRREAAPLELAGELLGVGLVHLTADRPDVVGPGHAAKYSDRLYNPAACADRRDRERAVYPEELKYTA